MYSNPNKENLKDFASVLKRAIQHGQETGELKTHVSQDQLTQLVAACDQPVMEDHEGKPIFLHRIWRVRIARMYWRENGRDPDEWPWNIDWEAIWNWLVENIVPIVKALLPLLLFLI
jgi:hypothetical protein